MFGKNPIRPRTHNPLELAVEKVFPTIQGEGPYSGMPCVFIRLAGCNLACSWCDTSFETGIDNIVPVEDLVAQVHEYPKHVQQLVVITGGEPLRQNIALLVEMLLNHAGSQVATVQIETAGTLWDHHLDKHVSNGRLRVVCSPKTPGVNPGVAAVCTDWKYIVRATDHRGDDGLPMQGTQTSNVHLMQKIWRRPGGWLPADTVWLSPCDEHDDGNMNQDNTQLVGKLALQHGYRVSLQTHKILDVE